MVFETFIHGLPNSRSDDSRQEGENGLRHASKKTLSSVMQTMDIGLARLYYVDVDEHCALVGVTLPKFENGPFVVEYDDGKWSIMMPNGKKYIHSYATEAEAKNTIDSLMVCYADLFSLFK